MVQFFTLRISNNFDMYSNDYIRYFETYKEAYDTAVNDIPSYSEVDYDTKGNIYTFYIVKHTIDASEKTEDLISVWDGKWLHGDECDNRNGADKFYDAALDRPDLFMDQGLRYCHEAIFKNNVEKLDEINGYVEFCKKTLTDSIEEEIKSIYSIIQNCNITDEHLLELYNKIDVLSMRLLTIWS